MLKMFGKLITSVIVCGTLHETEHEKITLFIPGGTISYGRE